jgi:hypothetical protein
MAEKNEADKPQLETRTIICFNYILLQVLRHKYFILHSLSIWKLPINHHFNVHGSGIQFPLNDYKSRHGDCLYEQRTRR